MLPFACLLCGSAPKGRDSYVNSSEVQARDRFIGLTFLILRSANTDLFPRLKNSLTTNQSSGQNAGTAMNSSCIQKWIWGTALFHWIRLPSASVLSWPRYVPPQWYSGSREDRYTSELNIWGLRKSKNSEMSMCLASYIVLLRAVQLAACKLLTCTSWQLSLLLMCWRPSLQCVACAVWGPCVIPSHS